LENKEFQKVQIAVLNSFFKELNERSYDYCVLRNFERLPQFIGNDLDILLSIDALDGTFDIAQRVMRENGFYLVKHIKRFGHTGLYYEHSLHSESIVIDLLTRIVKIWYDYADCNYILRNRVKYKNFYVPQKGVILYTLIIKDLLTYGHVRSKNDLVIKSVNLADRESFIYCGENYFSKTLLVSLFDECVNHRIQVKRSELFWQLQRRTSMINILKYCSLRLKELFVK